MTAIPGAAAARARCGRRIPSTREEVQLGRGRRGQASAANRENGHVDERDDCGEHPHADRSGVEGGLQRVGGEAADGPSERLALLAHGSLFSDAFGEGLGIGARDEIDETVDAAQRRHVRVCRQEGTRQEGVGEGRLVPGADLEELTDDSDDLDLRHDVVTAADYLTLLAHREGQIADPVTDAHSQPPGVLLGDHRLGRVGLVGEASRDEPRLRRRRAALRWSPRLIGK